jgi:hypothetical protein
MELHSGDVTVTEDFLISFSVPIFTEAVFMFDLTPDVCKLLPVEIDVPVSIIPLGEFELDMVTVLVMVVSTISLPELVSIGILANKTILPTGPIVTSARTDDPNSITIEKKTSKLETGKDNSASIDTGIPTGISKSTSTVISSGSQTMGDNSMKDVGLFLLWLFQQYPVLN